MTFLAEPLTFTSSLTNSFKRQAKVFSLEQRNSEKARQVYLNTLAVQAVHFYCDCMGIETEVEASESWNSVSRTLMDVADLVIPGMGQLECRPILPGDEICSLPPEVQEDRLGYIVVAIDEEAYEAKLLGFSPVFQSQLVIRQLASLDDVLDMLAADELVSEMAAPGGLFASMASDMVRLGQWFSDLFDELWQEPTLILSASYRGAGAAQESETIESRKRVKRLNLAGNNLALVLQVTKLPNTDVGIVLEVRAVDGNVLPESLELQLLDDSDNVALSERTGRADNFKKFEFELGSGDTFGFRLNFGDTSMTEYFST